MNLRNRWMRNRKIKCLAGVIAIGLFSLCWDMPKTMAAPSPEVAEPQIVVNRYRFDDETIASGDELKMLLADQVGKPATFKDLEKLADKVTRYLRSKGYLVALAYIPPQDFKAGTVKISIEPGRYDQIVINNKTKIHEKAIRRELGKVKTDAIVEKDALERAAWLIGDMANAEAKTALAAGSKPGTTTLTINVMPKAKPNWGYVGVDNGGYRYTGRYQYTALYNHGNPFREGDLFTASFLYTGHGQTGGSVSYTSPFLNQGSRWSVSYARSQYSLGGPFSALGAAGTADTLSVSYQKNFKRSRNANLYGQIRFETKKLKDEMDLGFSSESKKHSNNWILGINGDSLDAWQGGGSNTYSLTYTYGKLGFDDWVSEILDDPSWGGPGTAGHFGKWNLNVTRLQQIRERLALYMTYSYQWANKNLDSSEKMSLGGPYGVRAYPIGEASGDEGWIGSGELRWNLPGKEGAKNTWQLIAFMDGGSVQINHDNPRFGGNNRRTLGGWGVGVNWSQEENWAARLHYARKIGSASAESDHDHNGRIWFQLYRFY